MVASFENFKEWLESDGSVDFDIHAQNPSEWAWMSELVPTLVVSSAGGMFPFQAEGLIHGLPFYFRQRGESVSLSVGEADGEAFGESILYSAKLTEEELADKQDFVTMFLKLVPKLAPAKFLWRFEGKKLTYANKFSWEFSVSDTEKEDVYGWGMTPEEGLAFSRLTSAYLVDKGCSAELQEKMWLAKEINPTPINEDNRVWPEATPNFEVKAKG